MQQITQDEARNWQEKYEALVQETGIKLYAVPSYTLRDDGTWSLIIKYELVRTPQ